MALRAWFSLNSAPHQERIGGSVIKGLRAHGIEVSTEQCPCDFAVAWGWRRASEVRSLGYNVLVLERGYVGDRFTWTSMAWNGLNGRGEVPAVDDGGGRWRKHFAGFMKPWKKSGDCVIVMAQVPGDQSIAGVDIESWYRKACQKSECFGLPVYFRLHPRSVERGLAVAPPNGYPALPGTLAAALERARYVVTFNSNSAVDAVLAGVRTVTYDPGSMAWEMTGHELGVVPPMPERDPWASRIAWRQWRIEEIEAGEPWDYLRSYLQ